MSDKIIGSIPQDFRGLMARDNGDATFTLMTAPGVPVTAARLGAVAPENVIMVTPPAGWCVQHNPAAAAQATISRAAGGAGVKHVCRRISATIATGATAQTPLTVYLRDGATGVGTVLAAWTVAVPANSVAVLDLDNLNIVGSANTILTLEFSAAGVAASVESVVLIGFDVS